MRRPSIPTLLLCAVTAAAALGCHSTDPNSVRSLYRASVRETKGESLLTGVSPEYLENQLERIQRTRELVAEGAVDTGEECMYAAAILSTSPEYDDIDLARELGFKAEQLGEPRGLPIAAEAIDKLLMMQGRLQKYGTQMTFIPVLDTFRMQPVDPSTTDEERAVMGLPTLAELEARVERMNALKADQGL